MAYLLREILGDDTRTEYLVDALLAPLAPELFLYQREVRGMSLEDMIEGWQALADGVDRRRYELSAGSPRSAGSLSGSGASRLAGSRSVPAMSSSRAWRSFLGRKPDFMPK